jgi:hypothetical protein
LSSRAPCCQVVDEVSVDDVGESPFEAAQRFEVGLALVALVSVVVLTGPGHAVLNDRGDMQRVVEPAVAAAVEPVAVVVSGGHVDRCGARVAGEVVPAAEPADVAGLGDDLRGVDGSDSVDLQQRGRFSTNTCAMVFFSSFSRASTSCSSTA